MRARTLLILCAAAAGLLAKDRAWQTGQLLDNHFNPFFRTIAATADKGTGVSTGTSTSFGSGDNGALAVKSRAAEGDVSFDNYVIAGDDLIYLVEFAHFKGFPTPNLPPNKPVTFAVEKNKIILRDQDKHDYETTILKMADKKGKTLASTTEPAKPEPAKVEAKPAPSKPVPPKPAPAVVASVAKPAPKPEPKAEPVRAATISTKDRAWQSGHLVSVADNGYFFNVTYTSDADGSTWPFSQGSDGRLTVTGQIGNQTASAYTYDNYVIESEFVAYLVQRMRPKTSPAVRLPGTKPLKFAVEKGKLWVLDEQGIEYESKVIKLLQKDSIVNPLTRAAVTR